MEILLLVILVLSAAASTMAGQGSDSTPTPKPSLAVCKEDLKIWSADKTETLSIDQSFERMDMMVACGDEAKKRKE